MRLKYGGYFITSQHPKLLPITKDYIEKKQKQAAKAPEGVAKNKFKLKLHTPKKDKTAKLKMKLKRLKEKIKSGEKIAKKRGRPKKDEVVKEDKGETKKTAKTKTPAEALKKPKPEPVKKTIKKTKSKPKLIVFNEIENPETRALMDKLVERADNWSQPKAKFFKDGYNPGIEELIGRCVSISVFHPLLSFSLPLEST